MRHERPESNCLEADLSDCSEETLERVFPKKGIADGTHGNAFLVRRLHPGYPFDPANPR